MGAEKVTAGVSRQQTAIVVGAGPNGLVTANLLVDAGWLLLVICAMRAAQGLSWRRLLHPGDRPGGLPRQPIAPPGAPPGSAPS